ncbi:Major facilitator superfamily domain general substrate transporter [Penicillium robsamsonii]|uniref:Major facilitator superfamily domain general substrate transporter n=1 Tax=Penicillium robsamsonii TaxID=1792511 RepID=UPI002549530D|nr:Major facilitator superfamily domain general substrate transporter [Penicillium robsamsonii]KAJ5834213.1 Major facilitator superfamily domain general substrate transporter [Penicillium robsamsonii]
MGTMDPIDEKPPFDHRIEDIGGKSPISEEEEEEFTPQEKKKILRRIDLRLVTMTGLAYCISLMDRTNLSMAAVAGLKEELRLDIGERYSITVLMFFVPYIIFQPPMTIIIRKLGPTYFLSSIIVCWAGIMIGMGFVQDWGALVGARVLLGVLEAGYFPGCVYLLSCWYTRYDVQKRFSIFYLIGCVASALAGILAFGLMQLNGKEGLSGWRWIFILEGVLTGIVGILCFFFLVDFPDRAHKSWRFLNERECAFIVRRINKDRNDGDLEAFSLSKFLKPALDLKIWAFGMIFFSITTVTYAISYFLPIILRLGMGYGVGESQCLVAPPYGFAGIVMYATAWVGDKYRIRAPIIIFNALLAIIGLPMMGFAKSDAVRYLGVFFTVAGANANIPSCMAYQANNVRGQWTRAFSSATLVGLGGLGGIVSSLVFREEDAPGYEPGMYAAIACNILIIILALVLSVWFRYCNKQADRGKRVIEGDAAFRYTI